MTYKIFYGPGVLHFFEKNSTVVSGQPNREEFEDETEAVSRVLELDKNFFPQWDREEAYEVGDRVNFLRTIYRALKESDSRAFELPALELDPDALVPTPANSPELWVEIYRVEKDLLIDLHEADEQPRRRAHNADGTFRANDPATPENEAWS